MSSTTYFVASFKKCFEQVGPVVLYDTKSSLLAQYNAFRAGLGNPEICAEIDALLQHYRDIPVPQSLLSALEKVQKAKPFEIDNVASRKLIDMINSDDEVCNSTNNLVNDLFAMFMKCLRWHVQFDRDLIINRLNPSFINDFTEDDLDEIVELMKLDTVSVENLRDGATIVAQRHKIQELISRRREKLYSKYYGAMGSLGFYDRKEPLSITLA